MEPGNTTIPETSDTTTLVFRNLGTPNTTQKKTTATVRRSVPTYTSYTPNRPLCQVNTETHTRAPRVPVTTPMKLSVTEADSVTLQKYRLGQQTLEKQLGTTTKQLEAKEATMKLYTLKIAKMEEQVRGLNEENKAHTSEKVILRKEIADLKAKLASKQRSAYEVKVKTLEFESSQSQEMITYLKTQVESLTNEKNSVSKEKENLEEKIIDLEKSLSSSLNQVSSLKEDKKKVDEDSLVYLTKLNESCKNYDILKRDYDRLSEDNMSIKKQLDIKEMSSCNKDLEISTLLSDLNMYRTDIAKLQSNLENTKVENVRKDHKLEYITNELNSSKSKIDTLQREMDQTSSRLFKVNSEFSLVSDQYQGLLSTVDKIKDELALSKQEVSQQHATIEDQRSMIKDLQGNKMQEHAELQKSRSDLNRLTYMINHLKEEKQIALQEIEYLKSTIQANSKDYSLLNQNLSSERLLNSDLKNQLSAYTNENMVLKSQIEEYKYRESTSQQKYDEKITSLQNRYESEINAVCEAKIELEEHLNELENQRVHYEVELTKQKEAIKLEYEQQLVDLQINRSDTKKNCSNLTYELSLAQRENERLKDKMKSREAKIEHQKEQLKRVQKLEDLNTQLKEQLSHKETALITAQHKYKQLQSTINSFQHNSFDQVKQKEDNEKLIRKVEESEMEIKALNEKIKVSSLQIEELLLTQQPISENEKKDWITKLRKENLELKTEISSIKQQLILHQTKLRQKQQPTNSVARFRQSTALPPNNKN